MLLLMTLSIVGATLLDLTYGARDKQTTERYLRNAQDTANILAQMFLPGALLVQYLPFLHYLPSWLPGSGYKERLESWKETFHTALNVPFDDVKAAMVRCEPRYVQWLEVVC